MSEQSKKSYTPMRVVQVGSLADLTQASMMGTFFDCGNRAGSMMRMMMNAMMYPVCIMAGRFEDDEDE